jgi:ketosteroid isomerase-like protein
MENIIPMILVVLTMATALPGAAEDDIAKSIIEKERVALDRWGNGDPEGYLELMAEEFTYFDPSIEWRIDGLDAITAYLRPLKGKIYIERFEMANPVVQLHGDTALLSYNLLEFEKQPDGSEKINSRWNSTEVYAKIGGEWKLIHSHWSFTKPELK